MPPKMIDSAMLVSSPEQESPTSTTTTIVHQKQQQLLNADNNNEYGVVKNSYDDQDHVTFIEDSAEDDFLKRIYDNTVHGSCQLPETICQVNFDDQLDVFTNCRQPLFMFSFFKENENMESVGGVAGVEVLPAGAYLLPKFCEYCKATDTKQCPSHCERPKLYFQKKRPPFQKLNPDRWNPQTDWALTTEETKEALKQDRNENEEVASVASTDDGEDSSISQSKSRSADNLTLQNDTTFTAESYETGVGRRQSWLEMWSSSGE